MPCKANHVDPNDTSKIVCECTLEYCDNLVFDWPKSGELLQVTTTKLGRRFHLVHNKIHCDLTDSRVIIKQDGTKLCEQIKNGKESSDNKYSLHLSLTNLHQDIMGFGGSFTDAAVLNMDSLPDGLKDVIVDNYYGDKGLQYSIARVPIGGSDFSTHAYSYDDTEDQDLLMTKWKLTDEDLKYKIPYLKKAMKLYKNRTEKDLKIFASSWSPPKWMKTNKAFERGFLRGGSGPDGLIFSSYASYLLKFLEAYKNNGINLWGMTLQNEPGTSYLPIYFFNSLQFPASDQINFIKYHLGPQLIKYGYTKDKFKLIIGDDSIGIANRQVDKIMKDKEASSYVSGLGIHWYMNDYLPLDFISSLYKKHKDAIEFVLSTESCNGWRPSDKEKVIMGDWSRGISYFDDIVNTINRNVNGWIDWNLALDLQGGPNWSGNFVDAPIIVDSGKKKLYKNPMFYILGHFSRFVPPNSRRVDNKLTCDGSFWNWSRIWNNKLKTATFVTPSNHLIVVIANLSKELQSIAIKSIPNGREEEDFTVELEGDSVTTLVYGLNPEKIIEEFKL